MLEQTWRWFGPSDPVTLSMIRQAGVQGIVTALHEIPNGEIWPVDAIRERQSLIESHGMRWSVVESVPVHEDIKRGVAGADRYLTAYTQTLRNLAECGIRTVCYNFMPAVDWTRTSLGTSDDQGVEFLKFDMIELALFDCFVLGRPGSQSCYSELVYEQAKRRFEALSPKDIETLTTSIIKGLPGSEESWTVEEFREVLAKYTSINDDQYRQNFIQFLKAVTPVAEECGMRLAVHPDDPPISLFGLARVVSTVSDLELLFREVPSVANGLTLCVGSFGSRCDNHVLEIIEKFNDRIQFVHLRNVTRTPEGSFSEANHLEGDLNMAKIMTALIHEQQRRKDKQQEDSAMPWRPDHGGKVFEELEISDKPGYSAIGRLKGLSEVRGLEIGIRHCLGIH